MGGWGWAWLPQTKPLTSYSHSHSWGLSISNLANVEAKRYRLKAERESVKIKDPGVRAGGCPSL